MAMRARSIECEGVVRTLEEWAQVKGLTPNTIRSRIDKQGWDVARALSTPADRRFRKGGRPKVGVPRQPPKLALHPASGQAYARWHAHGQRHVTYFGKFGSAVAEEAYRRFAAEWVAGSVLGDRETKTSGGLCVAEVLLKWIEWCGTEYRKGDRETSEAGQCRTAARITGELYGTLPAEEFGPNQLRAVRAAMVARGWVLQTVNISTSRVVRAFRWAVGRKLVPAEVHQTLAAVEWLKKGRGHAKENAPVGPAPDDAVAAVLKGDTLYPGDPIRAAVLGAMIRLQRVTGMRPGEVCGLRLADLDRSGPVWVYRVADVVNKNTHRGKARRVHIGPRGQEVLRPYLDAAADGGMVFRLPGGPVTVNNYGYRVRKACERAGVERWHPHQLRHALATEVARRFGSIDHAAAVIGDTAATAAAVYVHCDPQEAARIEVAQRMG